MYPLLNFRQLAANDFVVGNLDKKCPATLLHDSVTLVEVFGILWTRAGEVVSAQQAADVPQVPVEIYYT